jgi:hypothetical protein
VKLSDPRQRPLLRDLPCSGCDWGECSYPNVDWRWHPEGRMWLPVCRDHQEPPWEQLVQLVGVHHDTTWLTTEIHGDDPDYPDDDDGGRILPTLSWIYRITLHETAWEGGSGGHNVHTAIGNGPTLNDAARELLLARDEYNTWLVDGDRLAT